MKVPDELAQNPEDVIEPGDGYPADDDPVGSTIGSLGD
jgi:hypothetical protein